MNIMKKVLSAVLVLVLTAQGLLAGDLVLIDGRYLQVKFLKGDERGVLVKLLDTGGQILIPWKLIRESDRDRLMRRFGLKEDALEAPTEKGVLLVARSGDQFMGVPETVIPPGQIPPEVVLWIRGRKVPFKADQIRSLEVRMVPSMEAYTRKQLYERQLNRFPLEDDDLEGQWDMARYCVSIGFYEKAILHFTKVVELDPEFRADYVSNQLKRLESLARNERILNKLREAMRKGFYNHYSDALAIVEQLLAIQELDPEIKLSVELKQKKLLAMRWKYYQHKVVSGYYRLLDRKLRRMAIDKKLKLNQARRELRSNVHKEIIAELSQKLGLDGKKETEKMWDERKLHGYRVATYGSGSFIILGKAKGADRLNQQVAAAVRRSLGRNRGRNNNRNGSFQNATQKLPKPPTPDEWWDKRSSTTERVQWMKAYYAENSGKLQVVGERWRDCPRCGGTGYIRIQGSQGEILKIACPRSAGHKRDKGIAYK